MAATDPVTPDPRRFSIRLPSPAWIFAATVVLVGAFVLIRGWLLHSWQKQTIDRFLRCAHDGDFAKCRAMLAEDHSAVWLLDEHALQVAADRPLMAEPVSFVDFVRGRRCFSVHLAYSNDHSFTVAGGQVTLGSAFWLQFIPPAPEFKLTRRVRAVEEDSLSEDGESGSAGEP